MSVVNYKFENTQLIVTVDPNNDGKAVLTINLDLADVPTEIFSLIKPK